MEDTVEVVVAVVMVVAAEEEGMELQHPLTLGAGVDTAAEVVAVTAVAVVEEEAMVVAVAVAMVVALHLVMARGTLLAGGRAKMKTPRTGHQFASIFSQPIVTYCYLSRKCDSKNIFETTIISSSINIMTGVKSIWNIPPDKA